MIVRAFSDERFGVGLKTSFRDSRLRILDSNALYALGGIEHAQSRKMAVMGREMHVVKYIDRRTRKREPGCVILVHRSIKHVAEMSARLYLDTPFVRTW